MTEASREYVLDPEASRVWIRGSSSLHPIRASATGLTGDVRMRLDEATILEGSTLEGEVRIDVEALRSGNPLVDRETRRRINAAEHRQIVGVATASRRLSASVFAVEGEIAFRGTTRAVSGEIRLAVDPSGASAVVLEGSRVLDVRDWGLDLPRLGLLKVHPDVEVRIRLVARPR